MRISSDNLLLTTVLSLALAAAAVVAGDQFANRERQSIGKSFQAAVGGLGLGPHADLSHCVWQFDPRLASDDDAGLDALPGIHEYNPWHATALFPFNLAAGGDGLD